MERSTVVRYRKGSGISDYPNVFVWVHWWVVCSVGVWEWQGAEGVCDQIKSISENCRGKVKLVPIIQVHLCTYSTVN